MDYYEYKNFCTVLGVPTVARKRFANEFAGKPHQQALHLLYWQHRNAGNSHKQACALTDACLPPELTDEFIQDWLARLAPFPAVSQKQEPSYVELVRQYEAITGKPYSKFSTKSKLVELIKQAEKAPLAKA